MLMGCYYHQLDSLLTSLLAPVDSKITVEEQLNGSCPHNDFLRLEYLAACKIMQDVLTADQYLPYIPHRLYPALFQAAAQKQFSVWDTRGGPQSAVTLSLVSLMQHWPHKVMTVQDLMPPLIVSFGRRNFKRRTLTSLREEINKFCFSFLNLIPFSFLLRYAKDGHSIQRGTLSKLDVSGYYGFLCNAAELKKLEERVKAAYNPLSPPDYDKCELVMDICGLDEEQDVLRTLGVISTLSLHHGAGLVVEFRRVHFMSWTSTSVIPLLEILAKNNSMECLELEACEFSDDLMNKIVLMSRTLSGLSMAYNYGLRSVEFLTLLPNLCQLDMSGVNLHGKVGPLCNLHQGLRYLKLVGCSLRGTDLDVLENSHHTKSLLQLDLSENSFSHASNGASLCGLFMALKKVVILELENCVLHNNLPENIRDIVDILVAMPKLRLLRLTDNNFSERVINEHLPHLSGNKTLQYVCLTVPSEAYLSDDYNVVKREIAKIQSDFTKRVRMLSRQKQDLSSPHLFVEWDERLSYSHWYYSV